MSLTLKAGKFYDSAGNVVPLEIGNIEQFKLLQAYESMVDGFCALGSIQCLCGGFVYRNAKPNGEFIFKGHKIHCPICGECFEFYADGEYGVPAAKLIPQKRRGRLES